MLYLQNQAHTVIAWFSNKNGALLRMYSVLFYIYIYRISIFIYTLVYTVYTKTEVAVLSDQIRLVACRNFDIFGWLSVIYSLKVDQLKQQKLKKILQRCVIYISDQITMPYLNTETGNRRLNIVDGMFSLEERG